MSYSDRDSPDTLGSLPGIDMSEVISIPSSESSNHNNLSQASLPNQLHHSDTKPLMLSELKEDKMSPSQKLFQQPEETDTFQAPSPSNLSSPSITEINSIGHLSSPSSNNNSTVIESSLIDLKDQLYLKQQEQDQELESKVNNSVFSHKNKTFVTNQLRTRLNLSSNSNNEDEKSISNSSYNDSLTAEPKGLNVEGEVDSLGEIPIDISHGYIDGISHAVDVSQWIYDTQQKQDDLIGLLEEASNLTREREEERQRQFEIEVALSKLDEKERLADDMVLIRNGSIMVEAWSTWKSLYFAMMFGRKTIQQKALNVFRTWKRCASIYSHRLQLTDMAVDKLESTSLRIAIRRLCFFKAQGSYFDKREDIADQVYSTLLRKKARKSLKFWFTFKSRRLIIRRKGSKIVAITHANLKSKAVGAWLFTWEKESNIRRRAERLERMANLSRLWNSWLSWLHQTSRSQVIKREYSEKLRAKERELNLMFKEKGNRTRGMVMRKWYSLSRQRRMMNALLRIWYKTVVLHPSGALWKCFSQWRLFNSVSVIITLVQARWRGYVTRALRYRLKRHQLLHYVSHIPKAVKLSQLQLKRRTLRLWSDYLSLENTLDDSDCKLYHQARFLQKVARKMKRDYITELKLDVYSMIAVKKKGLNNLANFSKKSSVLNDMEQRGMREMQLYKLHLSFEEICNRAMIRKVRNRILAKWKRQNKMKKKWDAWQIISAYCESMKYMKLALRDGVEQHDHYLFRFFFLRIQYLIDLNRRSNFNYRLATKAQLHFAFHIFHRRMKVLKRARRSQWDCPQYYTDEDSLSTTGPHRYPLDTVGSVFAKRRLSRALYLVYKNSLSRHRASVAVYRKTQTMILQLWHLKAASNHSRDEQILLAMKKRQKVLCEVGLHIMKTYHISYTRMLKLNLASENHYLRRLQRRLYKKLWSIRQHNNHLYGLTWVVTRLQNQVYQKFWVLIRRSQRMSWIREALPACGITPIVHIRKRRFFSQIRWLRQREHSVLEKANNSIRFRDYHGKLKVLKRLKFLVRRSIKLAASSKTLDMIPIFNRWHNVFMTVHRDRIRYSQVIHMEHKWIMRRTLGIWHMLWKIQLNYRDREFAVLSIIRRKRKRDFWLAWKKSMHIAYENSLVKEIGRRHLRRLMHKSLFYWYQTCTKRWSRRRHMRMEGVLALEKNVFRLKRQKSSILQGERQVRRYHGRLSLRRWKRIIINPAIRERRRKLLRSHEIAKMKVAMQALLHAHSCRLRKKAASQSHIDNTVERIYRRMKIALPIFGMYGAPYGAIPRALKMEAMIWLKYTVKMGRAHKNRRCLFLHLHAWHMKTATNHQQRDLASSHLANIWKKSYLTKVWNVLKYRVWYKETKRVLMYKTREHIIRTYLLGWSSALTVSVRTKKRCADLFTRLFNQGMFDTHRMMGLALRRWKVKMTNNQRIHFLGVTRVTIQLWRKAYRAGEHYRRRIHRQIIHAWHVWAASMHKGRVYMYRMSEMIKIFTLYSKRSRKANLHRAFLKFVNAANMKKSIIRKSMLDSARSLLAHENLNGRDRKQNVKPFDISMKDHSRKSIFDQDEHDAFVVRSSSSTSLSDRRRVERDRLLAETKKLEQVYTRHKMEEKRLSEIQKPGTTTNTNASTAFQRESLTEFSDINLNVAKDLNHSYISGQFEELRNHTERVKKAPRRKLKGIRREHFEF